MKLSELAPPRLFAWCDFLHELGGLDLAAVIGLGVAMSNSAVSFFVNSCVTSIRLFSTSKFMRLISSESDDWGAVVSPLVTMPKLSMPVLLVTMPKLFMPVTFLLAVMPKLSVPSRL